MEVREQMNIRVVCNYGAGDRPAESITDSLILSEDEAIKRGYDELNKRWKQKEAFSLSVPYPPLGHLIRPGVFVRITNPEVGLISEDLYVTGVKLSGDGFGVMMRLECERYEDWEKDGQILDEGAYGAGIYGAGS
jgi:hypothetical protein